MLIRSVRQRGLLRPLQVDQPSLLWPKLSWHVRNALAALNNSGGRGDATLASRARIERISLTPIFARSKADAKPVGVSALSTHKPVSGTVGAMPALKCCMRWSQWLVVQNWNPVSLNDPGWRAIPGTFSGSASFQPSTCRFGANETDVAYRSKSAMHSVNRKLIRHVLQLVLV